MTYVLLSVNGTKPHPYPQSQRPPRGDTYSKDGHAKVLLELVEVEILLSTKVASFMSLFQVCQHSQSMFGEGEACRHKNILYLRPSENAVPIHSRFLPQENIPQCQNVITVIDDVRVSSCSVVIPSF